MNPGELKDKISLLQLAHRGNAYSWETDSRLWAKVEHLTGSNLFSKVGLGARSIKLTIRKKSGLTLHKAFLWQGNHCFLTEITEIDRRYYEVTAALVEPKACSVKRTGEPTRNELNRPVYPVPTTITFPACLTEKYLGHTQGNPMAYAEITYVLVTPKVIELYPGELVEISGKPYKVLIPHVLDEYKNEYEILAKGDV